MSYGQVSATPQAVVEYVVLTGLLVRLSRLVVVVSRRDLQHNASRRTTTKYDVVVLATAR